MLRAFKWQSQLEQADVTASAAEASPVAQSKSDCTFLYRIVNEHPERVAHTEVPPPSPKAAERLSQEWLVKEWRNF